MGASNRMPYRVSTKITALRVCVTVIQTFYRSLLSGVFRTQSTQTIQHQSPPPPCLLTTTRLCTLLTLQELLRGCLYHTIYLCLLLWLNSATSSRMQTNFPHPSIQAQLLVTQHSTSHWHIQCLISPRLHTTARLCTLLIFFLRVGQKHPN